MRVDGPHFIDPADGPGFDVGVLWECPRCGSQAAFGKTPGLKVYPPTCRLGHEPVECEQKMPDAWNTGSDPSKDQPR